MKIKLTPKQEQHIYRKVELRYNMEDAERHINTLIEGCDKDSESERLKKLESLGKSDYRFLAEEFQDNHDCNLDDNSQWMNLIENYIR